MPESVVQPAYGPTLAGLLRARFGLSPRRSIALVVGLLVVVALAGTVIAVRDRNTKLVHRGEPFTFNLVITPELRERAERGDELLRVAGRRGGVDLQVTVSPLRIPAYGPGTGSAYLPVFAEDYLAGRRAELDGYRLIEEGKQRRDTLPGYMVVYRSGPPDREVVWRDTMLIPEEPGTREGVLLRMRHERVGRIRAGGRKLTAAGRRAFRSFAPGEDRP